jgi:hypothetical protein
MIVEPTGSSPAVTGAIRHAARVTGTDFQYLLATAQVESNFQPNAQVATSSARGLFQFIEQTWLATLKQEGPALGYAPYAEAIGRLPSGEYVVTEPRLHRAVMNLRSDPTANAVMAGAFTRSNAGKLAQRLGRAPSEGELYVAHFLGPNGASRLIGLAETRPLTEAAAVFPGAARANRTIFYDKHGRARSVGEVYRVLIGRYRVARGGKADPAGAVAGKTGPPLADLPPLAGAHPSATTTAGATPPARADAGPVFHGLFRSSAGEAVAPLVSALWTVPPATQASEAKPQAAPAEQGSRALDLFQEQLPDARALFRGRV